MEDMADKPVFSPAKCDLGIQMACEQFDKLGLTMTERFHVAYSLAVAAAAGLGKSLKELADMYNEE